MGVKRVAKNMLSSSIFCSLKSKSFSVDTLKLCACTYSTSSAFSESQKNEVVIVGYGRTPFGSFQGHLSSFSATKLASIAIRGALQKSGVKPDQVQEVILGNVLTAGLGAGPARQSALESGLAPSVVCTAVNKVCASGMKAVMLGAQSIALGIRDVVVTAGTESCSSAPYLVPRVLPARKTGGLSLRDSLEWDSRWDPHSDKSVGVVAENLSSQMSISREDQDDYAIESYQRAATAQAIGVLATEIIPVHVGPVDAKGKPQKTILLDEECSKFDPGKLKGLHALFNVNGTITVANSASVGDGAAALVLTSAEYAEANGLKVLARVRGFADAEQAPEKFPTTPAKAIPLAIRHAGMELKDIHLFEINETFSVSVLANNRLMGLDHSEVNIHGGAVSLGHPIGATGVRILISLLTGLAVSGHGVGVAAIGHVGGGASAMVLERNSNFRLHRHGHEHWSQEEVPIQAAEVVESSK